MIDIDIMKEFNIAELGEREIINRFIAPVLSPFNENYKFDDCALILENNNGGLLISTDQGPKTSFLELLDIGSPADIGHFHLTLNISDIAAMGGEPLCFVMALSLNTNTTTKFLEGYIEGIRNAAEEYKVNLIGGDTKEGDTLRNSITIIGRFQNGEPLGRHLALPGQDVFITGPCGRILSNYIDVARNQLETGNVVKLLRPKAKVDEGLFLYDSKKCRCCIDMSDGLLFSAEEIGRASGVSIALDLENLPIAVPSNGVHSIEEWKRFVLNVGGDCDLLFTLGPEDGSIAKELGAIKVGEVLPKTEGNGGLHKDVLVDYGYDYAPWEHFKSSQRICADIRGFI